MAGLRGAGLSRAHLTLDGAPLIDPRNPEVSERRGIGPHDMTGVSRYSDDKTGGKKEKNPRGEVSTSRYSITSHYIESFSRCLHPKSP